MKNYKIDPGELNKRITIYRITGQKDAAGYLSGGPLLVKVRDCWAKFTRESGTEKQKNNADFSEVRVRFLIRTPPAETVIDRKMIVSYREDIYQIEYVNDYDDEGQYTELICMRGTTNTEAPDQLGALDSQQMRAVAAVAGVRRYPAQEEDR